MKHPMQPVQMDDVGTIRFKKNKIVDYLLNNGGFDMNSLALVEFSDEDREQFAQLIGYSVGGFGGLSYVSDSACKKADNKADKLLSKER